MLALLAEGSLLALEFPACYTTPVARPEDAPVKKSKKPPPRSLSRWRNTYYVKSYLYARDGYSDAKIAKALGVSRVTFLKWRRADKALRVALKTARKPGTAISTSFSDYVAHRLPDALKDTWDRLCEADADPNPVRRVEALLAGRGEDVRQHLFVHAFVTSNFNKAEACRRTNVSPKTLKRWAADPEFAALCDQVAEMKKDFVDAGLMGLVGQGDTAATIFAAKTLLRDRGYDTKQVIEHQHTGGAAFTLEVLPLDLRTQILDWADKNGYGDTPALAPHVPDAEYTVKGDE